MDRYINFGMSRYAKSITVLGVMFFMSTGCTAMQFKAPPELAASSQVHFVNGPSGFNTDPKLDFGGLSVSDFEATQVERKDKTDGFDLGAECKRQASFQVSAPSGQPITVACKVSAHHRRNVTQGVLDDIGERLMCTYAPKNGTAATLEMKGSSGSGVTGALTSGGKSISFLTQGMFRTGAIFQDAGQSIAAVQLVGPGKVWLHNSLQGESLDRVGAALATLLLYSDYLATTDGCNIQEGG